MWCERKYQVRRFCKNSSFWKREDGGVPGRNSQCFCPMSTTVAAGVKRSRPINNGRHLDGTENTNFPFLSAITMDAVAFTMESNAPPSPILYRSASRVFWISDVVNLSTCSDQQYRTNKRCQQIRDRDPWDLQMQAVFKTDRGTGNALGTCETCSTTMIVRQSMLPPTPV